MNTIVVQCEHMALHMSCNWEDPLSILHKLLL